MKSPPRSRPRRRSRRRSFPATPGYVGRLAQRDALRAGLSALLPAEADGSPAVYVITGMGGIGKTALAVLVAHQVSSGYPDGQLYADLKGASPRPVDPHATLGRILRELGVARTAVPAETDERVALFRSTLALRRVLLLLDDARDAAQVRPLIPGAAGCAVLVTSRRLLAGLDGARRVELGTLDTAESRTMFERILGPVAARLTWRRPRRSWRPAPSFRSPSGSPRPASRRARLGRRAFSPTGSPRRGGWTSWPWTTGRCGPASMPATRLWRMAGRRPRPR